MSKCIACAGTHIAPVLEKNFCQVLRCSDCGLGRVVPPADFNPNNYYTEAYFQGGVSDGYADYTGSQEILRSEFRQTVRQILRLNCRRTRLLEFGCAYGFFLQEARVHFESVQGIELSEEAARFCNGRGLDVVTGVVDESALKGTYDVIVGLDVIEHIPEPRQTIGLLAGHLNRGGLLVMTTGDWSAPLARMAGRNWRLMVPPQHLSFFTPTSMRALLESSGLRVCELSHPWKRVPLSLIAYQLQRIAGLPKPRRASWLHGLSLPVNLGDAMRVVARLD